MIQGQQKDATFRVEKISLDRTTHKYSPLLPSVTEILQAAGLIDVAWFTVEARERGSAVHRACELYDRGILDFESLDARIEPYVRAYMAFRANRKEEKFEWIETPMMDQARVYAGTPDRILQSKSRAVWDLKTGGEQRWHSIQLAAYVHLFEDEFTYDRFCIYLKNDGSYQVRQFSKSEYFEDINLFNAALVIHDAKSRGRI